MFGMQCVDSSGRAYFDTVGKNYYHCVGKLVSRVYPYTIVNAYDNYIRVPDKYKSENYLFVMKAQDQVTSYYGDVIPRGLSFGGTDLQIVMGGRSNARDAYQKSATEVYVYFRGSVSGNNADSFGVEAFDENNNLSFSSSDQSKVLQITSTYSARSGLGSMNLGVRDDGVLIGSQPATVYAQSPGYATIQGIGIYISKNSRDIMVAQMAVGYDYFPGGFQKSSLHLSFVKLPNDVPVIPW